MALERGHVALERGHVALERGGGATEGRAREGTCGTREGWWSYRGES